MTPEAKKEENKTTAPASAPSKRDRSPNYPSLTFTEALERTKRIWDKDKKHAVTLELASQHIGYNKVSGASLPVIGAMKRYGLLVSDGKDVRVSDDAHFIFVHPEDAPERKAMAKKLAMKPALFGEVLAKFPDGLPSDANLRARLMTEWAFATTNAADNFIKALRESVAIAENEAVANGEGHTDNGVENAVETSMNTPQESAIKPTSQTITAQRASQPAPLGMQSRPWDLGDSAIMTVTMPQKLTKKNIARLKKYVQALEMEAQISWDDEDGDEQP